MRLGMQHQKSRSVLNKMMKKCIYIGCAILFIALLGLWLKYFFMADNYPSAQKTLRFNYTLANTSSQLVPSARFSLMLPAQVDGIQTIKQLNSSYIYDLKKELDGRQAVEFNLENIAPFATKIIDLSLVVEVVNKPKKESIDKGIYLTSEKYIELESPYVKDIAGQFNAGTATESAKNIYEWLVNNIQPENYTADKKGAVYALKNKTGDCTEAMYAFVALARANGIPARGVSGYWVPGDSSIINAADYHDWAEFYDGKRWVLVDVNKKVFDSDYFNYVVGVTLDADTATRWHLHSSNTELSIHQ
jgi:hypothetical protein